MDVDDVRAPRPLITLAEDDLAHWSAAWEVDRAVLAAAVRRYGPSLTAVARALGKPAEI